MKMHVYVHACMRMRMYTLEKNTAPMTMPYYVEPVNVDVGYSSIEIQRISAFRCNDVI